MLCPTIPPPSLRVSPSSLAPTSVLQLPGSKQLRLVTVDLQSLLGTARFVSWASSLQPSSFSVFMKSALCFLPSLALTQYVVFAPGQNPCCRRSHTKSGLEKGTVLPEVQARPTMLPSFCLHICEPGMNPHKHHIS